jgi:hypothetical protein
VVGTFNVPFYALNAAKVPPGGGKSYEERQDYHQRYMGFEISGVKRMSNHWMARFGFSTNSHREYFDSKAAQDDPTPFVTSTTIFPNVNGGLVLTKTTGSGKSNIYMVLPQYQFIANGCTRRSGASTWVRTGCFARATASRTSAASVPTAIRCRRTRRDHRRATSASSVCRR